MRKQKQKQPVLDEQTKMILYYFDKINEACKLMSKCNESFVNNASTLQEAAVAAKKLKSNYDKMDLAPEKIKQAKINLLKASARLRELQNFPN